MKLAEKLEGAFHKCWSAQHDEHGHAYNKTAFAELQLTIREVTSLLRADTVSETECPKRSESGESFLGENDYRELLLECSGLLDAMTSRFTTWAEVKVMRDRIDALLAGGRSATMPTQGETPRTDAAIAAFLFPWGLATTQIMVDFARQLERELAGLQHRLACIAEFDAESITLAEERGAAAATASATRIPHVEKFTLYGDGLTMIFENARDGDAVADALQAEQKRHSEYVSKTTKET